MYGTLPTPLDPRPAFKLRDEGLSRAIHDARRSSPAAPENHSKAGELVKAVVYGGVDGILTSCAMMTGASGGNLSPLVVLVLGVSNMIADGASMGIGDFISTHSYHDHVREERRREEWEFDLYPEGEIEEMVDLYVQRGLPRDKAIEVVATMAKYKDFFLDLMVIEELGLKVPDKHDLPPWQSACATAVSFCTFGSMPLLVYAVLLKNVSEAMLMSTAFACTLAMLFALGTAKSRFSNVAWWRGGGEFVLLGGAVAAVSFVISKLVSQYV